MQMTLSSRKKKSIKCDISKFKDVRKPWILTNVWSQGKAYRLKIWPWQSWILGVSGSQVEFKTQRQPLCPLVGDPWGKKQLNCQAECLKLLPSVHQSTSLLCLAGSSWQPWAVTTSFPFLAGIFSWCLHCCSGFKWIHTIIEWTGLEWTLKSI